MLRYRDGDFGSFETLYRRYEKSLLNFIYRLAMNPSEAENLYQETYYRVIRSKNNYRATAQFKTWLFQIALNLCRDSARRMKHRSHISLNSTMATNKDEGVELQQLISDPTSNVAHQVESDEMVSLIKNALTSLPEKEHLVFVLKEYQEMKFTEISEILDCPIGTVLSLNHRAQEKLKKILSKYLGN